MRSKLMLFGLIIVLGVGIFTPAYAQDPSEMQVEFPELTGDYAVGRADYDLIDASREEIFTAEAGDQRELLVTVYYPADVPDGAEPAAYASDTLAQALGVFDVLPQIHPHAYTDVPVSESEEAYPVLLFSPGMGSITITYSSLLEELASQGYIVAALWHPYSTGVTVFPDGRVVGAAAEGIPNFESPEARDESAQRIGEVWVGDFIFTLDQLEILNSDDELLAGRLDLTRIGALGHSFGGASSVQAAYQDERIDAALNMDGTMFGEVVENGSRVPFVMLQGELTMAIPTEEELAAVGMTAEEFEAALADYQNSVDSIVNNSENATTYIVAGAQHSTFNTDFLFLQPLLPTMITEDQIGTLDPQEAFETIMYFVSGFLDTYVMDPEGEF